MKSLDESFRSKSWLSFFFEDFDKTKSGVSLGMEDTRYWGTLYTCVNAGRRQALRSMDRLQPKFSTHTLACLQALSFSFAQVFLEVHTSKLSKSTFTLLP
jgi:hypothetical protein